jgi:hypothetical protein
MSPKVFGVGWAKTGTTTLGRCLRILGYRHVGQRLDLVPAYATGDSATILREAAAADAFEDWPWILLFRELDRAFPGSRFVLTTRDPELWVSSYLNMLRGQGTATPEMNRIRRTLYGLNFPDVTRAQLVARFVRHSREVQAHFRDRPDSLLVVDWSRGHGWAELCGFLGVREPAEEFPHENRGVYPDPDETSVGLVLTRRGADAAA